MKSLATIFQASFDLAPFRGEDGIDTFIPPEALPAFPKLPNGRLHLLSGIDLTDSTTIIKTLHRGDYWQTSLRGKVAETLRTDCPALLFTLLGPAGILRDNLRVLSSHDLGLNVRFEILSGKWQTYRDDPASEYFMNPVFRASRANIASIELTQHPAEGCHLRMVG